MTTSEHSDTAPSVTVLIATRGRPAALRDSVASILASDYPNFEVLLVDQSAPGDWQPLPFDPRLRHVLSPSIGKSRALNEGLAQTSTDLVVFTDDDCTVPPDWITRSVRTLTDEPGAAIAFGPLVAAPHDPAEGVIPVIEFRAHRTLSGRWPCLPAIVAGANMVARREVLEKVAGFDEGMGPGTDFISNEEWDVMYRMAGAGWSAVLDPSNPVIHWGLRRWDDGSGRDLLRRYRLGAGAVLGKHIACGDLRPAVEVLRTTVQDLGKLLSDLRHLRRPRIGPTWYFVRGMAMGLSRPIDRRTRQFRSQFPEPRVPEPAEAN